MYENVSVLGRTQFAGALSALTEEQRWRVEDHEGGGMVLANESGNTWLSLSGEVPEADAIADSQHGFGVYLQVGGTFYRVAASYITLVGDEERMYSIL